MSVPAIFLDRDGVINVNRTGYVRCWDDVEYLPGSFNALWSLTQLGLPLIVVTNQAGINRGMMSRETVEDIHRRMKDDASRAGARVDDLLYCPHRDDERCSCRKPEPGMLLAAAERYDIDLSRSVMVGDAHSDILAGSRAGCRTILVLTGRGREALRQAGAAVVRPTAIAPTLAGAVSTISALVGVVPAPSMVQLSAVHEVAAL